MYNVVELFSGIGSQAKALRNIGIDVNTVGTCEWDIHAIIAYDLIHNPAQVPDDIAQMSNEEILDELKKYTFSNSGKAPLEFNSLKTYSLQTLRHLVAAVKRNKNYVDVSSLNGAEMAEDIDILTYSFPCQDLSNVGAFHGYNKGIDKDSGSRSSLLWQVGRILSEMKSLDRKLPRFLLMENVPSLLSQRHFSNFSIWINDLKKLGYVSKYYQLNASAFGLPQNRPRLLMISVFVGENVKESELVLDYFKGTDTDAIINDYKESPYYHQYAVQDLLRTNYENQKLFLEAVECTPNNTVSRQAIWKENPQIVLPGYVYNEKIDVIRTITTKQDRNPNSGNLYFDSGIEGRSHFRYLTPRECLLFMGFTDEDYRKLKKNNFEFHKGDHLFARDKIIRMAGNSIPVKLLEGVFYQIVKIDNILCEYRRYQCNEDQSERAEKYSRRIKTEMFSKGIRCRQTGETALSAALVYPKYKTAIYYQNCFEFGHRCTNAPVSEMNTAFWEKRAGGIVSQSNSKYKEAIDMGWNAVVIWECGFNDENISNTMQMLEALLKKNEKTKRSVGEVIYIG